MDPDYIREVKHLRREKAAKLRQEEEREKVLNSWEDEHTNIDEKEYSDEEILSEYTHSKARRTAKKRELGLLNGMEDGTLFQDEVDPWLQEQDQHEDKRFKPNEKTALEKLLRAKEQEKKKLDERLRTSADYDLNTSQVAVALAAILSSSYETPAELMVKLKGTETSKQRKKGFHKPKTMNEENQKRFNELMDYCRRLVLEGMSGVYDMTKSEIINASKNVNFKEEQYLWLIKRNKEHKSEGPYNFSDLVAVEKAIEKSENYRVVAASCDANGELLDGQWRELKIVLDESTK